jgi:hypothetical protein
MLKLNNSHFTGMMQNEDCYLVPIIYGHKWSAINAMITRYFELKTTILAIVAIETVGSRKGGIIAAYDAC